MSNGKTSAEIREQIAADEEKLLANTEEHQTLRKLLYDNRKALIASEQRENAAEHEERRTRATEAAQTACEQILAKVSAAETTFNDLLKKLTALTETS